MWSTLQIIADKYKQKILSILDNNKNRGSNKLNLLTIK